MTTKVKLGKKKKIKDQFILSVGDEGAILSFFRAGKLENRVFIESPISDDIKLAEKLFVSFPSIPIVMLVDVIEQTYSQQVLPPVSSLGVKQQIQKRIKRDFQPNDLSNVLPLGRSKEGRKDWSFLFISLASTDPFAKWLEFVLAQRNRFNGVYLLPVESIKLCHDLNRVSNAAETYEWELLVLHNKIGGFRIVVLKNGKLAFTRLAQNLIGDNIPDIVVGNLEQEIANTVEYLKRLAFKGEQFSKVTIISSADVIQKVDSKALKFGKVVLHTPHQVSEILSLPEGVSEKDKFADVFVATHFASCKSHILKFSSVYTKKIELLYHSIKASFVIAALASLFFIFASVSELSDVLSSRKQNANLESDLFAAESKLREVQDKEVKLPTDYKKMQEIFEISNILPKDKYFAYKAIDLVKDVFGTGINGQTRQLITEVEYVRKSPEENSKQGDSPEGGGKTESFELTIDFELLISEAEQDRLETYNKKREATLQQALKGYTFEFVTFPQAEAETQFKKVDRFAVEERQKSILALPGTIKISGAIKQ